MSQTPPDARPKRTGAFRIGASVFCLALAVRLVFLLQYSSSPSFHVPIVDSATYDEVARTLAFDGRLTPTFFWHGFLYPLFLSGIYLLSGGSILAARIVQAVLGGCTAVLAWRLGSRIFDERTGAVAGLITAVYAPLFFFETELLATGLAALLAAASLLAALEIQDDMKPVSFYIYGICAGLSVLARATFLPVVGTTLLWLIFHVRARVRPWRQIVLREGLAMVSVAIVMLPVAIMSLRVTGLPSPLPRSGSINLYIGNNSDTDRTMMIRPGAQWRDLLRRPHLYGYEGEALYRQYFYDRVTEYAVHQPLSFTRGLAGKTIQMLGSRELPRTYDIYTARRHSMLLSALTWKAGRFGFPFGVLLPLALYGIFIHRKRIPAPVWIFLVLYPAAVILVFVSSRYRAPMIPVLAGPAAAGGLALSGLSRWQVRKAAATLAVLAGIAVAVSIPGPWITEDFDYAAEMHCCVGYQLSLLGRNEEAEHQLRLALECDPRFPAAHRIIGCVLQDQGRDEEALDHFELASELEPESYTVQYYLGIALLNQGRIDHALDHLRLAAEGARSNRDGVVYEQAQRVIAAGRIGEETEP